MIQPKSKENKTAAAEYEWPENYYRESDPEKRLTLLESRNLPDDDILYKIYRKRYTTEKQGKKEVTIDTYTRSWMMMKISAGQGVGFFSRKRIVKEWQGYADVFGMSDFAGMTDEEQAAQRAEWKAFFCFIIDLCKNDKTYGSTIFGMLHMSEDSLEAKIAGELEALTEKFPEELGMKDVFEKFHQCAAEAYEEME